ncbi:hypothetical protein [uncultured Gilvimarinus sp.]|uniref:hypothetical protein n=1 Tax=uncultured Gilvimarinus sp. TaxID=1689143 RepID=UPI0030DC93F3
MLKGILLMTLSVSLAACTTLSGSYKLQAFDNNGKLLGNNSTMIAQGSAVYSVRNSLCIALPGALIRITNIDTNLELKEQSPYQCPGQLKKNQQVTLDDSERWDFTFDERTWVLGNKGASKTQVLREYVPEGVDIKEWSELVSSAYFVIDSSSPARQHIEQIGGFGNYMLTVYEKQFAKTCKSYQIDVIKSEPDDMLLEWHHQGCQEHPAQHQVQRIVDTPTGAMTLSYVEKTPKLDDEKRRLWIALISAASLVPGGTTTSALVETVK